MTTRLRAPALILLLTLLSAALHAAALPPWLEAMAQEHEGDSPEPSQAAMLEPRRPVTAGELTYGEIDGEALAGYLARPEDGEPEGGILVIHEWWGLNDNIRAMTRRLAGEGYLALAVDLYAGEVASDREGAMRLVQGVMADAAAAQENLRRAVTYLEEQGIEDIGVIGWCFGGGWSLNTTLLVPEKIDATIIYYGRLTTDEAQLARIQSPVIGFFGAADQSIPVAGVREFEETLADLEKSVEVHVYEGAGHAFANPSGGRYDAEAARDAWEKTVRFLRQTLG